MADNHRNEEKTERTGNEKEVNGGVVDVPKSSRTAVLEPVLKGSPKLIIVFF